MKRIIAIVKTCSVSCYNCLVTKKSPISLPYRKLSLNKNVQKRNKIVFIRFFQISILQGYDRTLSQMFYKIGALENFCKIDRKTPVLKSLFKVAGLKRLHHKCFSKIFAKHLRTPDNKSPYTIKKCLWLN